MKEYHIGQTVVPYEINWSSDRETVGLSMDGSMELTVKAPVDASLTDVESVLEDKRQWILETLYGLSEQQDPPLNKEYLSGEKLLYNGRRYRLRVSEEPIVEPKIQFDGQQFDLIIPDERVVKAQRKRQTVVDWYTKQAKQELPKRPKRFLQKLGAEDTTIEVGELNRRWGEYEDNCVRLHWRLILAPKKIQDYVVAHELAHTRHDRHSDAFWNKVGTLVPDYRQRREWLRVNGATLTV
jgi:predicted metal-dependent hydrolase